MLESTAFGAAIAAGMAKEMGIWNPSELEQLQDVFHPRIGEMGLFTWNFIEKFYFDALWLQYFILLFFCRTTRNLW